MTRWKILKINDHVVNYEHSMKWKCIVEPVHCNSTTHLKKRDHPGDTGAWAWPDLRVPRMRKNIDFCMGKAVKQPI